MEIIKENIDEIIAQTKFVFTNQDDDPEVNCLFNYFVFLDENESAVIEKNNMSLDTILYSKYYWYSKFMNKYQSLYGFDAGIEQQQFKIIDEIDQRLDDVIDCELLEKLESDALL